MTILIAAGGTGGHLIPAVVVADSIKKKCPESNIVFIGTGKELEKKILSGTPYSYEVISSPPLVGQNIFKRFLYLLGFLPRFVKACRVLRQHKAKVVIGFGGYPSVLPVLAAWFLGVPGIIFEQNGQAGYANRFLSLFADKIFTVPGSSLAKNHSSYITNPVRDEIRKVKKWSAPSKDKPFQILILGGSQGAVRVNSAVLAMLPVLKKYSVKLLHQTGEKDYERVKDGYDQSGVEAEVVPYIQDMCAAYEFAHLIICRAGAGSVSEILSVERPAIFIPLAISHGHQYFNIKDMVDHGAALHVPQDESLDVKLASMVQPLLDQPERLQDTVRGLDEYKKRYSFRDGATALTETVLELYEKENN